MLKLKIISPEKIGEAESVLVPGTLGSFEILNDHAPIISSLEHGKLEYTTSAGKQELMVDGGFVEVQKNVVSVCVELPGEAHA